MRKVQSLFTKGELRGAAGLRRQTPEERLSNRIARIVSKISTSRPGVGDDDDPPSGYQGSDDEKINRATDDVLVLAKEYQGSEPWYWAKSLSSGTSSGTLFREGLRKTLKWAYEHEPSADNPSRQTCTDEILNLFKGVGIRAKPKQGMQREKSYSLTHSGITTGKKGLTSLLALEDRQSEVLRTMLKNPHEPWTAPQLEQELRLCWSGKPILLGDVDYSLSQLETKGLIKGGSSLRAEMQSGSERVRRISPESISRQQRQPKLSQNVYIDRRGERLARKHRRGWRRFIP